MADPRQAFAQRWALALGLDGVGWRISSLHLYRDGFALWVDGEPGAVQLHLTPAATGAPHFAEVGGVALSHGAPDDLGRAAEAFAAIRLCARHLAAQTPIAVDAAALLASTVAALRALRAAPLRSLLDDWPSRDVSAALAVRRWLDRALEAGLPPPLVEPSLDLERPDFRLICQPAQPDSGPRRRAEAVSGFLATLGASVDPAALCAFLAEARRAALVGVAAAPMGPVRAKLYLLVESPTPALAQTIGNLFGAASARGVDPAAHLVGIDLAGVDLAGFDLSGVDRDAAPDLDAALASPGLAQMSARPLTIKSYVRDGAAGRLLASEPLGAVLRRHGLDAAALEVHRCARRDTHGHIVDVSLHVHLPAAAGMAPGIDWAEASGAVPAARLLRRAATLGWRCGVLSQALGGGGGHVYLALSSPAADARPAGTASAS